MFSNNDAAAAAALNAPHARGITVCHPILNAAAAAALRSSHVRSLNDRHDVIRGSTSSNAAAAAAAAACLSPWRTTGGHFNVLTQPQVATQPMDFHSKSSKNNEQFVSTFSTYYVCISTS